MNSRISTTQRRRLVPLVKELAAQVQMPFNFVNGAILWRGERMRRPVTQGKLVQLVKEETLLSMNRGCCRKPVTQH